MKGCTFCILDILLHCFTNIFLPHTTSCDANIQNLTKLHFVQLTSLHFFEYMYDIASIVDNATI